MYVYMFDVGCTVQFSPLPLPLSLSPSPSPSPLSPPLSSPLNLSLVEMVDIMNKTAVPLDPVYTLKGVRGLLGELRENSTAFSGKRILYIHTGECMSLYLYISCIVVSWARPFGLQDYRSIAPSCCVVRATKVYIGRLCGHALTLKYSIMQSSSSMYVIVFNILYPHAVPHYAGGVFGLYDGKVDPLLKQLPSTNQVSIYSD